MQLSFYWRQSGPLSSHDRGQSSLPAPVPINAAVKAQRWEESQMEVPQVTGQCAGYSSTPIV